MPAYPNHSLNLGDFYVLLDDKLNNWCLDEQIGQSLYDAIHFLIPEKEENVFPVLIRFLTKQSSKFP